MMKFLNEIVDCLKTFEIELDNHSEDGRLNSAENEIEILNLLNKHFSSNIQTPNIRSWYDFKITDNNDEIFVNIKVSDLDNESADNISSKLGMGYALTGIQNMSMRWEKFHKQIKEDIKLGYDYYFLIVNKNYSCDTFWTSLKRIETLVPNGNNLPFQCNWAKNREFSNRNEIEATYYILRQYICSWDKKAKGYPFELKDLLINNKLLD